MKKIIFILLLMCTLSYSANRITGKRLGSTLIDWDYRTVTGVTTEFVAGIDTTLITGANDTLVSRYWQNWGDGMSIQLQISGGTTQSFYAVIEAANRNTESNVDSLFRAFYWLEFTGNSVELSVIATEATKIEITGTTSVITIPALTADAFRLFIYSDATQAGNTTIKATITRRGN